MHPVDTAIPLLKNRRERTLAQVSRQIKPPRGRAPCGSLQKWGGAGGSVTFVSEHTDGFPTEWQV